MRASLFFLTVSTATLLALASPVIGAESGEELIQQGDAFAEQFKSEEALKNYLPAERLEPNNAQLMVRIAREYRHLMSDAQTSAEKLRLGDRAMSYAKRAVTLAPNDPDAQLAVAIGYGKLLPLLGIKEQVADSRQIKAAVDKAIELDPSNDIAWQILGRWNLALADLNPVKRELAQVFFGKMPPGSYEDAVRCFEKAIALNPHRLMHYIELGRTYAAMGKPDEARKFIRTGLAMRNTEKDDPTTKAQGRQILSKLR